MENQFYAKGKLLFTAEFMILHGAKALAVPLNRGQSLTLQPKHIAGRLRWVAKYGFITWFDTTLKLPEMSILSSSSQARSENLVFMLQQLQEIHPGFDRELAENDVVTDLEFDPAFGFGSSSTLTSLLAQWAEIDPLQLHFRISKGSGYDVACAGSDTALLYQVINEMPVAEPVEFNPPFADQMWLVYLGHKQDSAQSVAAFLERYKPKQEDIDRFSGLTCSFLNAADTNELGEVITEHEKRLAAILDIPPVGETIFPDLDGYAKSLGAWGGDFVLLVTDWSEKKLSDYLQAKGIHQWFAFNELIN